jgi:hypothetical protein
MFRILPALVGLVALLGYGLVEGYWTQRWVVSEDLATASDRFRQVPLRIAEWDGEEEELDTRQAKQGEIHASLVRRYKSRQTGETLRVLLVCGRAGPIAAHGPEVCLGGSGFVLAASGARRTELEEHAMWRGVFHRPGNVIAEEVELFWAWNAQGVWEAPDRPRLHFARQRVLYKLYVSRPQFRNEAQDSLGLAPGSEPSSTVPGFLSNFVPELQRCLYPSAE